MFGLTRCALRFLPFVVVSSGAGLSPRNCALLLWLLQALFCARVAAQLVQSRWEVPFLPPFAAWQSGVLPYWLLFLAQLLIIALLTRVTLRMSRGEIAATVRRSYYWLWA